MPLRLYLLGRFQLERQGERIQFPRRKAESLLAYLALHPEEHAREKLAALFWGDSTDADARRSLRVTLTDLRRALGEEAFIGGRDALQLNPDFPLWVDAKEFMEIGDWKLEAGLSNLKSLVSLFQGDLLPNFYDDWIAPLREELRELYIGGLLLGAAACRSQSEYAQAIEFAQKILAVERAHEQAHQHLMFCYAALGDRNAALEQFEECQRALRDELGVEPSKETRALYESIRARAGAASPAARFTNLPTPSTSFIGRAREVTTIKALLFATRLLTLTGAGGSGKTRLVLQAAKDFVAARVFEDGVWWVELGSLDDENLVPQAVAKALGVQESASEPLTATLAHSLRPREALLVLDNCEHLIAACASLAEGLLSQCPHVQILATSREALNIAGEMVWRVPSLGLPNSIAAPDVLLRWEGIGLFVERAAAVSPDFRLTSANAKAVLQICRRLDGIPLAIELAAARLRALSVEQIAGRLNDRFKLLTSGTRTALPRQQTLRALMDWSYDLLSEPERVLFRRLAVFVGGRTLEAVEAVCADKEEGRRKKEGAEPPELLPAKRSREAFLLPVSDVLDVLTRLVDKSLVITQTPSGEGARYQMLETIWEYAREKLAEAGELIELQDRHLAYYAGWMEQAEPKLQGAEEAEWLNRLEAEHDNFRAALGWALTQERAQSVRLAGALWRFWYMRGYVLEAEAWLTRALEQAVEQATSELHQRYRARAFKGLATMAWRKGDLKRAEGLFREALALYQAAGDEAGTAGILQNISSQLVYQGRADEAAETLREALALAERLDNKPIMGGVLSNLGLIDFDQGDYEQAKQHQTAALGVARQIGSEFQISFALYNLGNVAIRQGDPATALAHYNDSLALARKLGNKSLIPTNLLYSGLAQHLMGQNDAARAMGREALELLQQLADKRRMAEGLILSGVVAHGQGQPEQAARLLAAAETVHAAIGSPIIHTLQELYSQTAAALRAEMGEAAFAAAWEAGRAMPLDEAVALALGL